MKNKVFKEKKINVGWTDKRLFDGQKFRAAILKMGVILNHDSRYKYNVNHMSKKALEQGISQKILFRLLDDCAKPMFNGNFLWRAAKVFFNLDLQIPVLFGHWTTKAIRMNLVTTRGKRIVAEQLNGVSVAPVTAIAIGVGAVAAATGDIALGSESTTNGGSRGAATCTNQTTTTTGDTARWVKTFTFSGALAVTEEGLFDNNTSGGNMLARQVFSVINVVNTDSLQITHNAKFA